MSTWGSFDAHAPRLLHRSRVLARYDAVNYDLTVRFSPVLRIATNLHRDELLSATGCTSVPAARDVVARQHRATPPHPKKSQHQRRTGKPPVRTTETPREQHHPLPYLRGQNEGRRISTTKAHRALPLRMTGVVSGGLPSGPGGTEQQPARSR